MESNLQRVGRREWWLWLSAVVVTVLSGTVYVLSSFRSLFLHHERFFEISANQARWASFSLLLLFDGWLVYRQWWFRRLRRQLNAETADSQSGAEDGFDPSRMDPVTGFYTRASVEQRLGKEVVRARRHNIPLSMVALHLDDFARISKRYGEDAGKQILIEFANCLRRASRGCDFCVRLANDDFLLILPECSLKDAKIVSNRLEASAIQYAGREIALRYSVSWIDCKPGEVPSGLLKRAADTLRLYKDASNEPVLPHLARQSIR